MATYTSYDQIGIAEDVSPLISDITPTDTPFFSSIKNEKVSGRVFEWQEDSLASAANNAQVEGADATMATLSPTVMRQNNTQILMKAMQIAATADAVKTHGRAKETALQLAKALKEIKRDLERAYVGVDNAAVTGDSSTAREMASATQQISTSVDAGANATDALTESKLLELGQDCYENGSDPSILMIKPADALIVADFAAASGRRRDFGDSGTVTNAVDIYVSPFGTYSVVINRQQLTTHAFLYDPSMWRSCTLRPFTRTLLAKNGDSDRHMIVGEMSLKHMNYSADGMITGLS